MSEHAFVRDECPMVLFRSDTPLAGDAPDRPPDAVVRAATELGIDLDGRRLFSFDAYRIQTALGEGLAS
jgi:hypothetical protein